mmetsp:Transcript_104545/g.181566  ORF Transcript_104545/g.181566 Transcript_104545/m.181566 type:complete len:82 (-) Transcript_104545:915-1160(-)
MFLMSLNSPSCSPLQLSIWAGKEVLAAQRAGIPFSNPLCETGVVVQMITRSPQNRRVYTRHVVVANGAGLEGTSFTISKFI